MCSKLSYQKHNIKWFVFYVQDTYIYKMWYHNKNNTTITGRIIIIIIKGKKIK